MTIQFRSMMLATTLLPETIPLPWHNLSDRRSMSLSQIPLSDTCPLYSSLCTVRAKERFSTGLGISISLSIAKSCGRPVENNNDESSLVQLSALNPHNGSSHVWEEPMKFYLSPNSRVRQSYPLSFVLFSRTTKETAWPILIHNAGILLTHEYLHSWFGIHEQYWQLTGQSNRRATVSK